MVSFGAALTGCDRRDEALFWHRKAVTAAPDQAVTHAALAVTLRRRLDAAGSIAACRRTLELAPDRLDIWLLLANNLAAAGQFGEAEACLRKALTLNPDSAEAQRDLAMIDRQTGDPAAIERLRATLDDRRRHQLRESPPASGLAPCSTDPGITMRHSPRSR